MICHEILFNIDHLNSYMKAGNLYIAYRIQDISDLTGWRFDFWYYPRNRVTSLHNLQIFVKHDVKWKYPTECCWTHFRL